MHLGDMIDRHIEDWVIYFLPRNEFVIYEHDNAVQVSETKK